MAQDGTAFWKIVEDELLPAARAGDAAGTSRALDELDAVYGRHRARVDALVAGAADEQKALAESSALTLTAIYFGLGVGVLVVLGGIGGALTILRRKVIDPLANTADTMQRMADGDLDAGKRADHNADEIGTMTRAIEVFRQSAIDAQVADAERKRIVGVLRERLSAMAGGNLEEPIEEFFAEAYKGTAIQELMSKSAGSITEGSQRVALSGNALREMIEIIDRISERVEQLAASSKVQADHLNEVNVAVAELERDTQQNAAMAEQSSAASELLKQEVTRLNERTATFSRSSGATCDDDAVSDMAWRRYG